MDFLKVINKKFEKKNSHFTTNISIYIRVTDILKFYEVIF